MHRAAIRAARGRADPGARWIRRYDLFADPDYELQIAERLTMMPRDFRLGLCGCIPADQMGLTSG